MKAQSLLPVCDAVDDLQRYVTERAKCDPEFKAGYEDEKAFLALIRANNAPGAGQETADALTCYMADRAVRDPEFQTAYEAELRELGFIKDENC